MVTQINLTDTGKYDTGQTYQTDAQVTSEEKAYGSDGAVGTALNLNITELSLNSQPLINNEVALQRKDGNSSTASFEFGELDMVGIDYNLWTIKGFFNTRDASELKDYGRLQHMCDTKGFKELRFSSTATQEPADVLVYSKYGKREYDGEATKVIGDSATPLNVRIIAKKFSQSITGGYRIDFELQLLETS